MQHTKKPARNKREDGGAAAAMHIRVAETTCYEITSSLLQKINLREKVQKRREEKELSH